MSLEQILAISFIVVLVFILGHALGFCTGFKRGQVGALSSTRVEYSLEQRTDGTKYWKYSGGFNLAEDNYNGDKSLDTRVTRSHKKIIVSYTVIEARNV